MKIASVDVVAARIPLTPERRMKSSLGSHDESQFVLVRLRDDDNLQGVGEATVTPQWSGETAWGAAAIIRHHLGPALVGLDPRDAGSIAARMDELAFGNWFAKAALEMACWDLAGRAAAAPVYELLGGACRPRTIRNRFSLGAYAPEVAAERTRERVAAGFTTIKVKVGRDVQQDVLRVAAVRRAAGDDVTLTIDANGGWTYEQAREALRRLDEFRIEWIEQPLQRGDYSRLRKLRGETGCRILADESCFTRVECEELIAQNCCDAITVYPGKHGGLLRAREIAELAGRHDIPCTIGSNLEWDVGAAAMMHFIVSTPNVRIEEIPGDCLGPSYHETSIAVEPLEIEGPMTTIPERPGLGVEVDWAKVQQLRIPDTG